MPVVIYAQIAASTAERARSVGRTVFDRLVGAVPNARSVFDSSVTVDVEDTTVAGTARWGESSVAGPVDSAAGQALLDRGWEATEGAFQRNLGRVKEGLEGLSDEETMRDVDLVRHAFYQVGAYDGPSISRCDAHGGGIRHRERLGRIPDEHDDRWIVPDDVHFQGLYRFDSGGRELRNSRSWRPDR